MNNERRKQLDNAANLVRECVDKLAEAQSIIEDAASQEREYYDNMSENLQGGEKGERAAAVSDTLDEIVGKFQEFAADDLVAEIEGCKE